VFFAADTALRHLKDPPTDPAVYGDKLFDEAFAGSVRPLIWSLSFDAGRTPEQREQAKQLFVAYVRNPCAGGAALMTALMHIQSRDRDAAAREAARIIDEKRLDGLDWNQRRTLAALAAR
jgi:hypothetical protein